MKFPGFEFFIFLFFTVGAIFAGISYSMYRSNTELVENGVKAKGTVIAMHRVKRRQYPVAPSVRFFTQDGREHVFHSSEGRNPPEYQVGEEITIYYDPKNPDNLHLEGNYLLVYVFAGMAAVFWLFSIWYVPSAVKAIWQWFFN